MAAPLIVSEASASNIVFGVGTGQYVEYVEVDIKMVSMKAWILAMYRNIFRGRAHTSP